jgi:hypothetical protein
MFFRKKKGEYLSDQQAVYRKRGAPRYSLNAGIEVEGFEGEGSLKNISISGCCMESSTYVSIKPDEVYKVIIKPDTSDNMEPFSYKVKATWTKSSETLFQAGFTLENSQNNTQMKEYVEILNSHGVKPDYGTK